MSPMNQLIELLFSSCLKSDDDLFIFQLSLYFLCSHNISTIALYKNSNNTDINIDMGYLTNIVLKQRGGNIKEIEVTQYINTQIQFINF